MVRLRSFFFGQREADSRDSGKVMLYPFMSNLALGLENETGFDGHIPRRRESGSESDTDR